MWVLWWMHNSQASFLNLQFSWDIIPGRLATLQYVTLQEGKGEKEGELAYGLKCWPTVDNICQLTLLLLGHTLKMCMLVWWMCALFSLKLPAYYSPRWRMTGGAFTLPFIFSCTGCHIGVSANEVKISRMEPSGWALHGAAEDWIHSISFLFSLFWDYYQI